MIALAWWQIAGALMLAALAGTLMGAWLMYEADHAPDAPASVEDDEWGDNL
jgi:hypothetical protein